MSQDHRYPIALRWEGSTGAGYDAYDREHVAAVAGVDAPIAVSADAAFRGAADLVNPEALLVLAAASCQLLSFLAVAARARIDVIGYVDDAEGVMPADSRPMRITEVRLRPRIRVRGPVAPGRLAHLVEVAHRECYIANSLRADVTVTARFEAAP